MPGLSEGAGFMMRNLNNIWNSRQKGFTLVEVLLAMAISVIIIAAVYMATLEGHRSSTGIEQKISVQEDVRAALDVMAIEIGMASYNPTAANGLWSSASCVVGGGVQAYKGIQTAANYATTITVEMDINGNGTVGPPDTNEIITYTYDTVNQLITRTTNCTGGNQSFIGDVVGAGDAAANRRRNVRVINNTLGINVFTYYDSAGNNITATLPGGIPNIRRIDITLAVIAADPDFQGQTRQMIHSTSVLPRNHAISF
jgi:prepilin-type N-terminal cleavage/methylation domain-containing protein